MLNLSLRSSAAPRDRSKINTLDYLLMTAGSMLAAYSAGMGINQPEVGMFFVRLIAVGTVFSFFVRRLLGDSWLIKADGFLYAVLGLIAVTQSQSLNSLLPGEPFPRALLAASWLGWMLTLGSFVTWRDGTLLFQAIPAIALFGLVGVYDTYRDVTFNFFGFLLCLATLFSRAHGRDMLRLVIESGFAGRAEQKSRVQSAVRQDQALYERMRMGPWQWMAGPEWALLSALVIVGLSLLGAPVIQATVQTVASNVKVTVPTSAVPQNTRGNTIRDVAELRVGNGPNAGLTARPLYEYSATGGNSYLRSSIYDNYTGSGWDREYNGAYNQAQQWIAEPAQFNFTITRLTPAFALPAPAEVVVWNEPDEIRPSNYGTYNVDAQSGRTSFTGSAIEPAEDSGYEISLASEFAETTLVRKPRVPKRVKDFVAKAIKGAKTDREKADRLRVAIGNQCLYNIKAKAVPSGSDPVDHFLFESREGYCDLFATTMTVLAREAGLPARYVQGFLPDPFNKDGASRQLVLEKDYHAWCEILFEDYGWVVYDATGDAQSVPGGERGTATSTVPFYQSDEFRRLVDGGVIFLGVVVVAAVAYVRLRPSGTIVRRREIDRVAVEFVKMLERRTKQRRRVSQTLGEYVRSLGDKLRNPEEASRLAEVISIGMYAPEPPADVTVKTIRKQIAALKASLRNQKS